MSMRPPWLAVGSEIYFGRVFGTVEQLNPDGSAVLRFTFRRHGFVSRRLLNASEVTAALESFDLRPRHGRI